MNARTARGLAAASVTGLIALGSVVLVSPVGAATACVPTVAAPTLEVETGPVALGDSVQVSGAGWCHPSDGGSRVAIKIDEGGFSHLDTTIHANKTIWAIVEADPTDGTFSFAMKLPDGTASTSTPAFGEGTHSLRALSGSIKENDTARTVKSNDFKVGVHRPNGTPDLLGTDDLSSATEDEVLAVWKSGRVLLEVNGGSEGDWLLASLLSPEGSQRYPWGTTWLQLDAKGRVLLPAAEGAPSGEWTLVVQNGNEGHVSELIGWTSLTFPTAADDASGDEPKKPTKPRATASATPRPRPTPTSGVTPPAVVPGASTPAAAVPGAVAANTSVLPASMPTLYRGWSSMKSEEELAAALEGDVLRVQLGYANAGSSDATAPQDIFVHVLTAERQHAGGWVQPSAGGEVVLDLRDLADGDYRFSLQDAEGKAIGWAPAQLSAASSEAAADAPVVLEASAATASAASPAVGERDLWLAGVGVALLVGLGAGATATRRPAPSSNSGVSA